MRLALLSCCWLVGLGCSGAAEPTPGSPAATGGSGGSTSVAGGGGGVPLGGSSGAAGTASGGGGGQLGGSAGGGGDTTGGVEAGGSGDGAGAAGAPSLAGAGGGSSSCVPNAAGALTVVGDTVHDAKSCLDWMKATQMGVNYAAAESFCSDSTLGGFDDWRIPNVNELASTVTLCGQYPPAGPIDTSVFDLQGDGYWTTTPAGELNKVCAIGMSNAGGYYHYGTAGPQVVRCVRGQGSVAPVADCTTAQGCKDW